MSGMPRAGRVVPWFTVALLGVIAGLIVAMLFSANGDDGAVVARVADVDRAPAVVAQRDDGVPSAGNLPPAAEVVAPDVTGDAAAPDGLSASGPPPVDVLPSTVVRVGWRLQVPSLGVDAPMVDLGFDAAGRLDVPSDGRSVGWYDVSSKPGEPGNALLGGHYDWDGSLAVFSRLSELVAGDRVQLDDGAGEELVYEVQSTASVDWDHPLSEILSGESGGSRLTLFTCGGDFDAERGEYGQRVVVWATLVESTPLTARQ